MIMPNSSQRDPSGSGHPVVVITQPNYLPWIGYFEQIKRSDIFVFLDNVQFEKREWQNRNRIKELGGKMLWLTVPVKSKGHSRDAICDIEIDYTSDWTRDHLKTLQRNYGKATFFEPVHEMIQKHLTQNYQRLRDLNAGLIKEFAAYLGISRDFRFASEMQPQGKRTDLLVDLCKKTGARTYYSSSGAKAYMEPEEAKFAQDGISLQYQDYHHPVYPQIGSPFLGYLSVVDLLFNAGPGSARYIDSNPQEYFHPQPA